MRYGFEEQTNWAEWFAWYPVRDCDTNKLLWLQPVIRQTTDPLGFERRFMAKPKGFRPFSSTEPL